MIVSPVNRSLGPIPQSKASTTGFGTPKTIPAIYIDTSRMIRAVRALRSNVFRPGSLLPSIVPTSRPFLPMLNATPVVDVDGLYAIIVATAGVDIGRCVIEGRGVTNQDAQAGVQSAF